MKRLGVELEMRETPTLKAIDQEAIQPILGHDVYNKQINVARQIDHDRPQLP